MLANLKYVINEEAAAKGCYIKSYEKTFDEPCLNGTVQECHFDPAHEYWVDHVKNGSVDADKTKIFFAVQTKTPGILGAFDAEDVIENMTTHDVVCHFPMISTRGEVYTQEDFSTMINKRDQIILPSGKPRPESLNNLMGSYGVADNLQQILRKYKRVLTSTDEVVLQIRHVYKKNQPEEDGWRWHKWGEYIGCLKPQHEYLYHEPNIDMVWIFSFILVKPKQQKESL